jgi:hypothetical protein
VSKVGQDLLESALSPPVRQMLPPQEPHSQLPVPLQPEGPPLSLWRLPAFLSKSVDVPEVPEQPRGPDSREPQVQGPTLQALIPQLQIWQPLPWLIYH